MPNKERADILKPILRWIGGKTFLVKDLLKFLPDDLHKRRYVEPFLGGGSLFFALQPENAILSDANGHLVNCYRFVRDKPSLVNGYLRIHYLKTSKDYYYRMRSIYNRSSYSAAQAARFIYLNKTCFNGIFRVNTKGEFNVPYGWKEPPSFPTRKTLLSASKALQRSNLAVLPFEKALKNATSDDFLYLDPPYPPLNGTSYFTHYTIDRFNNNDQTRLAELIKHIHNCKCKFLMTNADISLIRNLYKSFNIASISATRYVTCKAKKHRVDELIITNYDYI